MTSTTETLACPFCDRKGLKGISGLKRHCTTRHPDAEFTAAMAAKFSEDICPDCKKPAKREAHGKFKRHKCTIQRQPNTPQAQRDFMQTEEAMALAHVAEAVDEQLFQRQGPRPGRKEELARTVIALGDTAEIGDSDRMEALTRELLDLFAQNNERKPPRQTDLPVSGVLARAKRVVLLLQQGAPLRQARLAMSALPKFVITDDNIHMFRGNLTPEGSFDDTGLFIPRQKDLDIPEDVWTNDRYKVSIPTATVIEVLKSKSRTTGTGPSGMGYGALQDLIRNKEVMKGLTNFIIGYLNGGLAPLGEAARALRTARVIPLTKENGKPRCIAVREIIVNLAYSALVRHFRPAISEHLSRYDIGFGTQDCSAFPIHLLNRYINRAMKAHRSYLIVKLDIKNAYGTTFRSSLLRLLVEKLPKLVRPFLVGYEFASSLQVEGRESIEVDEGLLQGDPAAPAFAQLLYADCCDQVREAFPGLEYLISYFDDIVICGRPGETIEALNALVPILRQHGLEVQLAKSLAFSTSRLNSTTREFLDDNGLDLHKDGFMYLGSPVGTPDFVRRELQAKAEEVSETIGELQELCTRSRFDTKWADAQGLYALAHLSINHLLRHLLRTVNPEQIRQAFPQVDKAMLKLVGAIFEMKEGDLTPWRIKRITLPYRYGGLGFLPLTECADAAFLGCIHRHRRILGADPMEWVPGLQQAYDKIIDELGDDALPDAATLLDPTPLPKDEKERDIASEVLEKKWKKLNQDMDNEATDFEKFVSSVTSSSTCFDIFRAPISNRRYRVPSSAFVLVGRAALALSITRDYCTLCKEEISTDGQHTSRKHCKGKVTDRHNEIRDTLTEFFRLMGRRHDFEYNVSSEVPLDSIEGIQKRGNTALRCDFLLRHKITESLIFFDVQVVHPKFRSEDWTPEQIAKRTADKSKGKIESAVAKAWQRKRAKYTAQYEMDESVIQPMVFDTYGGYAANTLAYLFRLVQKIAEGLEEEMVSKLWSDLRYRIASTLAKAQARVLNYFHWRTRTPIASYHLSTPTSRSLKSPCASQESCSEEDNIK